MIMMTIRISISVNPHSLRFAFSFILPPYEHCDTQIPRARSIPMVQ
jgi:hypothetical protein